MDRVDNVRELHSAFKSVKSVCAGDTRFMAQSSQFMAEHLVNIESLLLQLVELQQPRRPKRKPTEWQRFFARGMKAGKTPKQIGAEWRVRKVKRIS